MSGRAGRRGLDDKGIVILMVDEKVPAAVGREIVKGAPDPINSAFHLTYNMVLNLLRVEEINPEYMLERSFYQFQNQTAIPTLHEDYLKKVEEYNSINIKREKDIASYYNIRTELDALGVQFRDYLTKSQYLVPFLQPGRLVMIKYEKDEYDWGIVINFRKVAGDDSRNKMRGKGNPKDAETKVIVDMLLHVAEEEGAKVDEENKIPKPCGENQVRKILPLSLIKSEEL